MASSGSYKSKQEIPTRFVQRCCWVTARHPVCNTVLGIEQIMGKQRADFPSNQFLLIANSYFFFLPAWKRSIKQKDLRLYSSTWILLALKYANFILFNINSVAC